MYTIFNPENIKLNKYLFFTGKGGVGKTSIASSLAINLADQGKKVILVSTDPASNLQDIFDTDLDNKIRDIDKVKNLKLANFEPEKALEDYKESVVGPQRGKLPDEVIEAMEEQLSGSCTTEVAAFKEFTSFIADEELAAEYDHIIFDTAPTGHTLRMLELPSAWTNFLDNNKYGASCLGQLSGLDEERGIYKKAVENLADSELTSLILVSRPIETALEEAARTSNELHEIGVDNQIHIINGMLASYDDDLSTAIYNMQKRDLEAMPEGLKDLETYYIPLKPYNTSSIENLRKFFSDDIEEKMESSVTIDTSKISRLEDVVDDLYKNNKKVILTMGKGGVGKTTIAAAIALALNEKGQKVHLATTDPADHLKYIISERENLTISYIDEDKELESYREEVLGKAKEDGASEEDIDYIEEDLRSPCTQEIAVFRAFADIVDKSEDEIVVIDTAPTGHTILLLESTESYNREISRSQGDVPESVKKLLPRLKDKDYTEVLIIALAEATPYYEAKRLKEDLDRAEIFNKWWIINSSYFASGSQNEILKARAEQEKEWIKTIDETFQSNTALVEWIPEDLKEDNLKDLL
ncbi:arsenical pump-driving ATPase [Facklamia hominis]|uniref:Arsenite-activated ATPase ArsA n=2 Tax=Facklamia hominis TaxID=178214 RepID=K1LH08_9LACT|nr:arsenical pump-driving ATPase [Facklamia hominis]EKB53891.1 arsenite-activated ATPase ArsA [Facklamia hominis CCUG 36813]MDK7187241.1 arsenical pump-driving ATPase [Facklamia hominis]